MGRDRFHEDGGGMVNTAVNIMTLGMWNRFARNTMEGRNNRQPERHREMDERTSEEGRDRFW